MVKYYRVICKHWIEGSGFSWEEDLDEVKEECTAEEYVKSLYPDYPLNISDDEDKLIQIVDPDTRKVLSECWAKEIEKEEMSYFED